MLLKIQRGVVLTLTVSMAYHTALTAIVFGHASLAIVDQVLKDIAFISTLLAHKVNSIKAALLPSASRCRGLRWWNLLCVMG